MADITLPDLGFSVIFLVRVRALPAGYCLLTCELVVHCPPLFCCHGWLDWPARALQGL